MAELQKDPITRGQFLWMGTAGGITGAVLTIPPVIFILDPTIKSALGQSDVPPVWRELGSVFEIPEGSIKVYRVEFPQEQTYQENGTIPNAVMVSWKDGKVPELLKNRGREDLSRSEIGELSQKLNIFSNACTHLGCPVRWFPDKGEILCPCHGGIYDINGGYVAGPPPRGLYDYVSEIRSDGTIRIKHRFENGKPYVY